MPRKRGEAAAPTGQPTKTLCDCGAALLASGLCSETGGYPASRTKCPLACPICRGPLDWEGACYRCYGSDTADRATWTFPGDRYEVEGAHRVRIARGPRKVCTPDEGRRAGAIVQAVRLGDMDPETALGMLDEVMAAHGGIPWSFDLNRETKIGDDEPGSRG